MIRVALDAMGSDHAPQAEIQGALLALAEFSELRLQLVGPQAVIEAELANHPGFDRSRLEILDAPDVVGVEEKPIAALRRKPRSSIMVGLGLQPADRSDAFVSAGNTGAVLAGSTVQLGLHDGVERATVGTLFPTAHLPVLVLDAGANVDCSPREMVGFAYLGTVFMRDVLGRATPKVGLLNIGEEDEKGNAQAKDAHQLLKQAPGINYVGNIEGRDILGGHTRFGTVDVVVCDGFVGNIVLKFYESMGRLIIPLIRKKAPEVLKRADMREVFEVLDYSNYGGAPLLGVKGITIICHGASTANAFKNAIRVAVQSVDHRLSQHVATEFAQRLAAGTR